MQYIRDLLARTDDPLTVALTDVDTMRRMNAVLESRNGGLQNTVNEQIAVTKSLPKKLEKLERASTRRSNEIPGVVRRAIAAIAAIAAGLLGRPTDAVSTDDASIRGRVDYCGACRMDSVLRRRFQADIDVFRLRTARLAGGTVLPASSCRPC